MDFANLVETMEAHRVSFVSVTQSFNTTTSMGRLTLNILLSFAQCEREVIGERIRDKVAALKARSMWMGGRVPLRIRRRPGRKTVVTPVRENDDVTLPARADPVLVKALARAFRYEKLLDEGRYSSITEMAAAERIERGYLGSLLRLMLLAPDIVEELINGHAGGSLALPRLLDPFPITWAAQQYLLRRVESEAGTALGSGSSHAREE